MDKNRKGETAEEIERIRTKTCAICHLKPTRPRRRKRYCVTKGGRKGTQAGTPKRGRRQRRTFTPAARRRPVALHVRQGDRNAGRSQRVVHNTAAAPV